MRKQLFNLIAQDENTLNRGIAEDSRQLAEASKRDSSAMKIIAFLTALFLPATFVAVSSVMILCTQSFPLSSLYSITIRTSTDQKR